jgi:hypothetical protein
MSQEDCTGGARGETQFRLLNQHLGASFGKAGDC